MSTDSTSPNRTVQFIITLPSGKYTVAGYGNDIYAVHASLAWNGLFNITHTPTGMAVIKNQSWDTCLKIYERIKDLAISAGEDGKVIDSAQAAILKSVVETCL